MPQPSTHLCGLPSAPKREWFENTVGAQSSPVRASACTHAYTHRRNALKRISNAWTTHVHLLHGAWTTYLHALYGLQVHGTIMGVQALPAGMCASAHTHAVWDGLKGGCRKCLRTAAADVSCSGMHLRFARGRNGVKNKCARGPWPRGDLQVPA